ncbi:MAG TPA: MATE family efflux transporter [Pseudonocardiaceae bacterium]|nr:MATE family efflux transporter [Pseudonocardiaceae bacterium]
MTTGSAANGAIARRTPASASTGASPRPALGQFDPSAWRLLRLGAPMANGSLVSLLGQFVVLGLLGQVKGDALYLRSVYAPIALLLAAVLLGIGIPMQVLGARCSGSRSAAALSGALGSITRIGLAIHAALAVTLAAGGGALSAALGVAAASRTRFWWFTIAMALVALLGVPAEVVAAALRGLGHTVGGTLVSAVSVVGSLLGFPLIDAVTGWGLFALPATILLAVAVQTAVAGGYLRRAGSSWLLCLRARTEGVVRLLASVGLPVAVSYLVLFVLNAAYLRILAPFGPTAVLGFTFAYAAQTMAAVPGVAFGSAIAIAVNQTVAAGHPDRVRRIYRRGVATVAACYGVVTVLAVLALGPVTALFVRDAAVLAEARAAVHVIAPTFGFMAVTLTLTAFLEETGHGLLVLAGNLTWAIAVVWTGGHLVAVRGSPMPLYHTMAVANVVGLLVAVATAEALIWRRSRRCGTTRLNDRTS